MKPTLVPLLCLLATFLLPACGGASEAGSSRSRTGRDRGSASMQVAGESWIGESAKARLRSGRLAIDLTRSDTASNITTRGQVKLSISKFEGPGTYPAGPTSMFVTVTIDSASLTSASGSEEAVTNTLKDALGGTKMQMLSQAEVIITSIDDTQVEGTFECTPGPGSSDPPITAGEFRALLK